jgi:hypothetical protein
MTASELSKFRREHLPNTNLHPTAKATYALIMNLKGRERKLQSPNLRYNHDIYLEGLRKATKNLYTKMSPPRLEPGVSRTQVRSDTAEAKFQDHSSGDASVATTTEVRTNTMFMLLIVRNENLGGEYHLIA